MDLEKQDSTGMEETMVLHHVGIAVKDIENTINRIRDILPITSIGKRIYDSNQDAELCMVTLPDGSRLELVCGNAVSKIVRQGINQYHICYEVDSVDAEIRRMAQLGGVTLVSEPKEAALFDNRRVEFVRTRVGLIELLEKQIV